LPFVLLQFEELIDGYACDLGFVSQVISGAVFAQWYLSIPL
jgi:hypothetical protein